MYDVACRCTGNLRLLGRPTSRSQPLTPKIRYRDFRRWTFLGDRNVFSIKLSWTLASNFQSLGEFFCRHFVAERSRMRAQALGGPARRGRSATLELRLLQQKTERRLRFSCASLRCFFDLRIYLEDFTRFINFEVMRMIREKE